VASALIVGLRPLIFPAGAALLQNRQVLLSNINHGEASTYSFSFELVNSTDIGSIQFEFCSDTPIIGAPCTPPTGLDTSGVTLADQTGETGFSIMTGQPSHIIVLTRTAATPTPGPVSYTFDNLMNPDADGSYYVRLQTFASEDASGPAIDMGGLAYTINSAVQITTTVPPFLLFCMGVTITGTDCATASGNYVNFGELSSNTARTGSTQMVVATNAMFGYSLSINGTTMLSGTNVITALVSNDVSRPGTNQFGVNLRNNSSPDVGANPSGSGSASVAANYNIPNRFRFISGEQVASSSTSDEYRKYTVSYLVNVAKDQAPGVYVSTITYICTATF
jgi:hypothetical protein